MIGSLTITTLGSTVDTLNGDQNPYGLTIASVDAGSIAAGDLIICNFNNGTVDGGGNVQGAGTTIEILSPVVGATPTRLVQDSTNAEGCDALATDPSGNIWTAALVSNLNPVYSPSGTLETTLSQETWSGPWGEAYVNTAGAAWSASVAVSNTDGTIVRVDITDGGFAFDTIASGFSVNGGAPGAILAPSGLTYDQVTDTLYIVDSNSNRVVSFSGFSTIPPSGIEVDSDGGFSGTSAANAAVLYAGSPLNAPISSAQLFNGDLVVGNTGDNNLIEISLSGQVVGTLNLDPGAAGALFGIAATGDTAQTLQIFFNDDNDNTVKVAAP